MTIEEPTWEDEELEGKEDEVLPEIPQISDIIDNPILVILSHYNFNIKRTAIERKRTLDKLKILKAEHQRILSTYTAYARSEFTKNTEQLIEEQQNYIWILKNALDVAAKTIDNMTTMIGEHYERRGLPEEEEAIEEITQVEKKVLEKDKEFIKAVEDYFKDYKGNQCKTMAYERIYGTIAKKPEKERTRESFRAAIKMAYAYLKGWNVPKELKDDTMKHVFYIIDLFEKIYNVPPFMVKERMLKELNKPKEGVD